MRFKSKLFLLGAMLAWVIPLSLDGQATQPVAVQPDCFIPFTFTSATNFPVTATAGGPGDNRQRGCSAWTMKYQNTGFTMVNVTVQSGASPTTTVTFGTFAGTVVTGANPTVSNTGGEATLKNGTAAISWVRVNLAASGSGTLTGVLYGFRNSSASVSGGAPTGSAGGDLCGTYPNPTVCGVQGAAIPLSATLLSTNASRQLVAQTAVAATAFLNDCSGGLKGEVPTPTGSATVYLDGTCHYSTPPGTGANTALSNLAGVSISQSLTPQSGKDLGSSAAPWKILYLYGTSGTFGSTNVFNVGANSNPTGSRNIFLPDAASNTVVPLAPTTDNFLTDIDGAGVQHQSPIAARYRTKSCVVITGDPGAASTVLADDNDSPVACDNDTGGDWTITNIACWADAGTPTVTPILTGGSGTSLLTGALTCGTAAWAAGTINGTPVVHTFSGGGATCTSTPCSINSNITTAGGTAKYLVVKISGTY